MNKRELEIVLKIHMGSLMLLIGILAIGLSKLIDFYSCFYIVPLVLVMFIFLVTSIIYINNTTK